MPRDDPTEWSDPIRAAAPSISTASTTISSKASNSGSMTLKRLHDENGRSRSAQQRAAQRPVHLDHFDVEGVERAPREDVVAVAEHRTAQRVALGGVETICRAWASVTRRGRLRQYQPQRARPSIHDGLGVVKRRDAADLDEAWAID